MSDLINAFHHSSGNSSQSKFLLVLLMTKDQRPARQFDSISSIFGTSSQAKDAPIGAQSSSPHARDQSSKWASLNMPSSAVWDFKIPLMRSSLFKLGSETCSQLSSSSFLSSSIFSSSWCRKCSSILLSSTKVKPLKLACMPGESGVDEVTLPLANAAARALRDDEFCKALVNSGSKLEVSRIDLSLGLNGGTTIFLVKASQSTSAKNG